MPSEKRPFPYGLDMGNTGAGGIGCKQFFQCVRRMVGGQDKQVVIAAAVCFPGQVIFGQKPDLAVPVIHFFHFHADGHSVRRGKAVIRPSLPFGLIPLCDMEELAARSQAAFADGQGVVDSQDFFAVFHHLGNFYKISQLLRAVKKDVVKVGFACQRGDAQGGQQAGCFRYFCCNPARRFRFLLPNQIIKNRDEQGEAFVKEAGLKGKMRHQEINRKTGKQRDVPAFFPSGAAVCRYGGGK